MALFFTVLLGSASCILVYLIFAFSSQNFIRETEAAIDADISVMVELHQGKDEAAFIDFLNRRSAVIHGQFYLLLNADGRKLSGNLRALPNNVWPLSEGIIRFILQPQDAPGLIEKENRSVAAKIYTFPNGNQLLVARDISDSARTFRRIQWLCGLIIGLMVIVVATSFVISTFVVSRINRIALTAQNIMDTGDLTRRISIDSSWDDLSNLAQVLNSFLSRIEQLMTGIRQVSDNIAHDLRTPLTRLRNQLEGFSAKQTEADAQDECEQLVSEADRMLETFTALLRIANIENAKRHTAFCDFAFNGMVTDVIELYEPVAEEKQISLQSRLEPFMYHGDPNLLFQVVANLLHNAIKFTPRGGTIVLTLSGNQLVIQDNGPGIADSEKNKVFERFYRTDTSRHTPGDGLGLSLVAAIIDLHCGHIALSDAHPGVIATITF
jgi:signal transduction histidine kinase